MTPEAKQTIIELLAQVARQNGAERVEVDFDENFGGPHVRARCDDFKLSVGAARWTFGTVSASESPTYARTLDLWSQVVSAVKAMGGRDEGHDGKAARDLARDLARDDGLPVGQGAPSDGSRDCRSGGFGLQELSA